MGFGSSPCQGIVWRRSRAVDPPRELSRLVASAGARPFFDLSMKPLMACPVEHFHISVHGQPLVGGKANSAATASTSSASIRPPLTRPAPPQPGLCRTLTANLAVLYHAFSGLRCYLLVFGVGRVRSRPGRLFPACFFRVRTQDSKNHVDLDR